MARTVLVIAPHPDDEAIGCGGKLWLHSQRGDIVRLVFLTSGERGMGDDRPDAVRSIREAEARAASAVLGALPPDFLRLADMGLGDDVAGAAMRLRAVIEACPPDLIYLPHPDESHPDHAATLPIVSQALEGLSARPERPQLRGYEVWSPMTRCGWVEDISAVMPQKLRAIGCYRSQLERCRYDRAICGLNQYRGVMAGGCQYAEALVSLNVR
jgi:LmbE family N-acetylglucosaminyl deacetylase